MVDIGVRGTQNDARVIMRNLDTCDLISNMEWCVLETTFKLANVYIIHFHTNYRILDGITKNVETRMQRCTVKIKEILE